MSGKGKREPHYRPLLRAVGPWDGGEEYWKAATYKPSRFAVGPSILGVDHRGKPAPDSKERHAWALYTPRPSAMADHSDGPDDPDIYGLPPGDMSQARARHNAWAERWRDRLTPEATQLAFNRKSRSWLKPQAAATRLARSKISDAYLADRYRARAEQPALDALLLRYRKLIRWWGSTGHKMLTLDELESAGRWGFVKAVNSYAPSRGASFPTHARTCIKRAKQDCIKEAEAGKHKPVTRGISLDEAVDLGDGEAPERHEALPDAPSNDPAALVMSLEQFKAVELTAAEAAAVGARIQGSDGDRHALRRADQKAREQLAYPPSTRIGRLVAGNGARGSNGPTTAGGTRTRRTEGLRGSTVFRDLNAKEGRDTARGGMPWPPRREAAVVTLRSRTRTGLKVAA